MYSISSSIGTELYMAHVNYVQQVPEFKVLLKGAGECSGNNPRLPPTYKSITHA